MRNKNLAYKFIANNGKINKLLLDSDFFLSKQFNRMINCRWRDVKTSNGTAEAKLHNHRQLII